MEINGIISLHKEKGITSFSAVSRLRKITNTKKAGHTGTLDPHATGVLVVCLGKSTRIVEYLTPDKKEYIVKMYLGIGTDTYDITGKLTEQSDISSLNLKNIEECIKSFVGVQLQKPPVYSAKKTGGRKLYEYARKGEEIEIKDEVIEIHTIDKLKIYRESFWERDLIAAEFTLECSKGTYIRSLCNDIGQKLGSFGTMAELCRSRNGAFSLDSSFTLAQIQKAADEKKLSDCIISIDSVSNFLNMDKIILNSEQKEDYEKGRLFTVECPKTEKEYLVYSKDNNLIGIGYADRMGILKSKKRLV